MPIGTIHKRNYSGIPIGILIRKQLGKSVIFRARRGNGFWGARTDTIYQDQYTYFVPDSITNAESAAYRTLLANAVNSWQNTLTTQQKEAYNKRANKGMHMSGYNLYVKEVLLGITSV